MFGKPQRVAGPAALALKVEEEDKLEDLDLDAGVKQYRQLALISYRVDCGGCLSDKGAGLVKCCALPLKEAQPCPPPTLRKSSRPVSASAP